MDKALLFALFLSLNDSICFSTMSKIHRGDIDKNWMICPIVLYGFQMIIFYYGLKHSQMD